MNRRGFFGMFGAAAAAIAMPAAAAAPRESEEERQIRLLLESAEQLRASLEKPINVQIRIDGRTIARKVITTNLKVSPELLTGLQPRVGL